MSRIRIYITNPNASHIEIENTEWIISGSRPKVAANQINPNESFNSIIDSITGLAGEYSVLQLDNSGRKTINAHRGITSSFDWFYTQIEDKVIISDHFREALLDLPVNERTVAESVDGDQLLLGTRPSSTYIQEVSRLDHGQTLSWDLNHEDGPDVQITESISTNNRISPKRCKKRLNAYFNSVLDADLYEKPATMLSGGVDSTLLQTYLQSPPTISASFDSPEFQFEVDYALEASELLNSDHDILRFDESEFLTAVEETTDATGHPLQHLQTTLMRESVAKTPYQTYFNGQLADGIFGVRMSFAYRLAWLTRYFSPLVPNIDSKIKIIKDYAEGLQKPAAHLDGIGMNFVIHADDEHCADLLGEQLVNDRKYGRLKYVKDRFSISNQAGYGPHMHLGHLIDFFQDNTVTPWRHAAHAHGKALQTPFAGKRVLETVLAVPPRKRYAKRKESKYILKELLDQRLPKYNTSKKKGSSALPEKRYQEQGPLSNGFDKYSIPDFIPEEKHNDIRNMANHVSWYAFAYAVWRDRILENPNLDHYESTKIIER